jgi:pimeloyl-ACP methyl ester carboxylesterase
MVYEIKTQGKFKFIEEGEGEPLVLLHGLFGAMSNFSGLIDHFRHYNKVVVPILPLFDLNILDTSVAGLAKYVHKFIETMGYSNVHPEAPVKSLILTGSSGLFENGMGETYPKRGDYEYIRKKTELTFYDPTMATKELVDEVFDITTNRLKVIKIITLAKSAIRHNLGEELREIKIPTLLVWGLNDTVTPPMVGEEFKKLIPNSELHFIDKCGHAPMMERPEEFNEILHPFLDKLKQ